MSKDNSNSPHPTRKKHPLQPSKKTKQMFEKQQNNKMKKYNK